MRILSLFSGIGGLELGLEAAGVGRTHWQVEKDPYCRSVLAKHWPDVERFEDVRSVTAENFPGAELICGGFPCQDISNMGTHRGLEGERSGLWGEFARLIREISPRFVIVENVPALTKRGLGTVVGDLLAQGRFDHVEWDIISALSVGSVHRRDRLWIIAGKNIADSYRWGRPWKRKPQHKELESTRRDQSNGLGPKGRWDGPELNLNPWETFTKICPVDDGIPGRVAMLRALGNAVVPQVAYQVGLRVQELAES